MKRIVFAALLFGARLFATQVSATVTSVEGLAVDHGTYTATLVDTNGNPLFLPPGSSYGGGTKFTGSMDNTGSFSLNILDNASIASGSQWNFTVCVGEVSTFRIPSHSNCFSSAQTISGATQSLSSALSGQVTLAVKVPPLLLPADPNVALGAATKNYVDTHSSSGAVLPSGATGQFVVYPANGTTVSPHTLVAGDIPSLPYDASGAATAAQSASLQKTNNLSDVASVSTARTNLGLGSAATSSTAAFDAAGAATAAQSAAIAASAQKSNNLSDLASAATARTNLGLGTAATAAASAFQSALGFTPENSANKGAASGYAPLNSSSQVPLANLPTLASIPSTTNLIKGSGSGNGADSGLSVSSTTIVTPSIGNTGQVWYFEGSSITRGNLLSGAQLANGGLTGNFGNLVTTSAWAGGGSWGTYYNDGVNGEQSGGICGDSTCTTGLYATGQSTYGVTVPSAHSLSPAVTSSTTKHIYFLDTSEVNNDCSNSVSSSTTITNLTNIVTAAKTDGWYVVLLIGPVVTVSPGGNCLANNVAVNQAARAGRMGANLTIDGSFWIPNQGDTTFYTDGLHPNAAGHAVIAANLIAALTQNGSVAQNAEGPFFNQPVNLYAGVSGTTTTPVVTGVAGLVMTFQNGYTSGFDGIGFIDPSGTYQGSMGYGNSSASFFANQFYVNSNGGSPIHMAISGTEVEQLNTTGHKPATVYSAAGTPLPTCGGGSAPTNTTAYVKDATAIGTTYTSGGSIWAGAICDGTNWHVF